MVLAALTAGAAQTPPNPWPSFRGPGATGVAADARPPLAWDLRSGHNVRWKAPIEGLAHSSPIVWGDRVFVTTAVSDTTTPVFRPGYSASGEPANETVRHAWQLRALDRATGQQAWLRTASQGLPRSQRHVKSSQASSTPATNGRVVVAFFGSEGLYAYDMEGRLKWTQDLGVLDAGSIHYPERQWGVASSPVIAGSRVIVQCDLQRGSFIAAFDLDTGARLWTTARDEIPSWASPVVAAVGSGDIVVANGARFIRGYDAATGRERWRIAHGSDIVVPTPVVSRDHGLAIVMSGYQPAKPIIAVRLTARGDASLAEGQETNEHVAWSRRRGGAYIPTPIVYQGQLYVLGSNGVLASYDVATGQVQYEERLAGRGGAYSASPVAADGRLYIASEDGDVHIVRAGARYELLASGTVDEPVMATPALSGELLIVRGVKHLFALGSAASSR